MNMEAYACIAPSQLLAFEGPGLLQLGAMCSHIPALQPCQCLQNEAAKFAHTPFASRFLPHAYRCLQVLAAVTCVLLLLQGPSLCRLQVDGLAGRSGGWVPAREFSFHPLTRTQRACRAPLFWACALENGQISNFLVRHGSKHTALGAWVQAQVSRTSGTLSTLQNKRCAAPCGTSRRAALRSRGASPARAGKCAG